MPSPEKGGIQVTEYPIKKAQNSSKKLQLLCSGFGAKALLHLLWRAGRETSCMVEEVGCAPRRAHQAILTLRTKTSLQEREPQEKLSGISKLLRTIA